MYMIHGERGVKAWFLILEAASASTARSKARKVRGASAVEAGKWTVYKLRPDKNGVLVDFNA